MPTPAARRKDDGAPMTVLNTAEARRQFADLLNRVLYVGERFALTRKGRVIAYIVPAVTQNKPEAA